MRTPGFSELKYRVISLSATGLGGKFARIWDAVNFAVPLNKRDVSLDDSVVADAETFFICSSYCFLCSAK